MCDTIKVCVTVGLSSEVYLLPTTNSRKHTILLDNCGTCHFIYELYTIHITVYHIENYSDLVKTGNM